MARDATVTLSQTAYDALIARNVRSLRTGSPQLKRTTGAEFPMQ